MTAQDSGIKIFSSQTISECAPSAAGIFASPKKRQPATGQNLTRGEQQQQQRDPN
jgi:hypothetical protein